MQTIEANLGDNELCVFGRVHRELDRYILQGETSVRHADAADTSFDDVVS